MSDNPWAAASGQPAEDPADAETRPEAEAPAANPWASASESSAAEDTPESGPRGQTENAGEETGLSPGSSWLDDAAAPAEEPAFSWLHPFNEAVIPLDGWIDQGLGLVVDHMRPFFQVIRWPVDTTLTGIQDLLLATPALLFIVLFALLAWQFGGRRLAIGSTISWVVLGLIGVWQAAMVTLALVLTSVVFCLLIGIPTGVWLSRSDRALQVARPILDAMQTTPAFVYLVPIVMLFGIGNVPGVVVTIIFALAPVIRLTNLGIRQVPADLVEAARAYGASRRQLLYKVQLPLAMPTIMAGVNQTLMMALSMVVIASMIAVGGLGQMVLRGIGRLDMGLATVGGIGIVVLAILLDRLTQSFGQEARSRPARHWYQAGPVGGLIRLRQRFAGGRQSAG
ncbi:MAG: glycine betaine/L-proline ABC transporter permease ProW [Halothiobacillaceae bacterium]